MDQMMFRFPEGTRARINDLAANKDETLTSIVLRAIAALEEKEQQQIEQPDIETAMSAIAALEKRISALEMKKPTTKKTGATT